MRIPRILIVDDDKMLLASLRLWSESCGFEVFAAASADEALAIAQREWLHLAIIDIRLDPNDDEDRSGFDLARKMWNGIPKIFLTSRTDYESTGPAGFEMREENVVGYVVKKEREQKLLQALRKT